jgi:hypothetical protein
MKRRHRRALSSFQRRRGSSPVAGRTINRVRVNEEKGALNRTETPLIRTMSLIPVRRAVLDSFDLLCQGNDDSGVNAGSVPWRSHRIGQPDLDTRSSGFGRFRVGLFLSQQHERVDLRGSSGRNCTREYRSRDEHDGDDA